MTRPLSPHLSIYKPQMSSSLSIFHRATGAGLFLALSFLSWYFIITVFYGVNCECWNKLAQLVGFCASFAFFYHICTGVRHLIWDNGWLLDKKNINFTSYIVIMIALTLSIVYYTA
jgi:succinate dehydrogenase / fumarate reductase cytochrome b subunit